MPNVVVGLPPGYLPSLNSVTRATDRSKIVRVSGPKSMVVQWITTAPLPAPNPTDTSSAVVIELPSGYAPSKPILRDTDSSRKVRVSGPNSMEVQWTSPIPPSPNGTRGLTYTDNEHAVFTIVDTSIFRNNVLFDGGRWARGFLWWLGVGYYESAGVDRHWWSRTFEGVWIDHGENDPETGLPPDPEPDPPAPPSPNGTRGETYTDNESAVFTVVDNQIFRDDVLFQGGGDDAQELLWWNGVGYYEDGANHWFSFNGVWIDHGVNDPETGLPPDPDSPNNTRITANSGSIWFGGNEYTIAGITIYENAPELYADGGWAIQALLHDDVIYVQQPPTPGNSHWYHHNGTVWVDDGLDDPETGEPPSPAAVLTLVSVGSGSGATSGGGSYAAGDPVNLSATPASGSIFAGWSPAPCAPSFSIPGTMSCLATFNILPGGGGGAVRSIITTGSTTVGSPVVRTQATGWRIGDYAMVATGWEPGQGWRGTMGVGGTWPDWSYPTSGAMFADTSKPNGLYVSLANTSVWRWWNGSWVSQDTQSNYYIGKALPRALVGRIIDIDPNGRDITLNRVARVTVNNALTCLDSAPEVNALILQDKTVPSGEFAVAGVLRIGHPFTHAPGRWLIGNGKNLTKFFSPSGVNCAQVETWNPGSLISDFTMEGNYKEKGWGLNWTGSNEAGLFQAATEMTLPQGASFTRGIAITGYAPNTVARNIRVIDCPQGHIWMVGANSLAEDMESIMTYGLYAYMQWMFNIVNGANGTVRRCKTTSPRWNPSFEGFAGATNFLFDACEAINGGCSSNAASGHFLNQKVTVHAGVLTPGINMTQLLMSVNANAGQQSTAAGNRITNPLLIQTGVPSSAPGARPFPSIIVGPNTSNVRIDGGNSYHPDGAGEYTISSEGAGTSTHVRNFACKRYGSEALVQPMPTKAVIFINGGGSVTNCQSALTWGPSPYIAPNW